MKISKFVAKLKRTRRQRNPKKGLIDFGGKGFTAKDAKYTKPV